MSHLPAHHPRVTIDPLPELGVVKITIRDGDTWGAYYWTPEQVSAIFKAIIEAAHVDP